MTFDLFFFFKKISSFSNDGSEFGGSVFQKVSPKIETGVTLSWVMGSNDTRFGIATKYQLDSESTVRAKVNNASQVGLSFQQKLRPGKFLFDKLIMVTSGNCQLSINRKS